MIPARFPRSWQDVRIDCPVEHLERLARLAELWESEGAPVPARFVVAPVGQSIILRWMMGDRIIEMGQPLSVLEEAGGWDRFFLRLSDAVRQAMLRAVRKAVYGA